MKGPSACGADVGVAVGVLVGSCSATVAATVGVAVGVAVGVGVGVGDGDVVAFSTADVVVATVAEGEGLLVDGDVQPVTLISSTAEMNNNGSAFLSGILMYRFIILVIGFILATYLAC